MIKAEEIINEKKSKNLTDLEIEYFKANKNPEFKKFTDSINLNDKILMKYTSSLMQCFNEKENCKNCKGLENCKNEIPEVGDLEKNWEATGQKIIKVVGDTTTEISYKRKE